MPEHIADQYRHLYREIYMERTLEPEGKGVLLEMWNESDSSFENCYVAINFDGECHSDILASCLVWQLDEKVYQAYIDVSPELATYASAARKKVLAHEWLHTMIKFRDKKLSRVSLSDYLEYLLLSNHCPWQDTRDLSEAMESALRKLLVSRESLNKLLEDKFGITWDCLKDLAKSEPYRAMSITQQLLRDFAAKHHVALETVRERFEEEFWAIE